MSVLSIAEEYTGREIDLINAIRICMSKGWLRSDFYIKDSPAILRFFTKKEWTRTKVKTLPKVVADNEYTVEEWYNKRTGFTHYKRRYMDTLESSTTVKEGVINEYYVYTVKD